ncbi:MAG: glycosyltransferase [Dysgonamonadaceae bacterium]|jgi:glycosyltransferase involved in cell wall biosynthesis|nr:glycosyltransferase [Dysgonamonadaceae bacterium]
MKTIVVSGVNLFRGGTLKIMKDCIDSLSAFAGNDFRIIALVHNEKQYPEYANVRYISYPKSRKSWLYRLYYEYIGFKKLSKQLKPDCWFSLHDTTPNVIAKQRMVYCHNTFSFYKAGLRGLFIQPGIFMFSVFSKWIHSINIKKNDYVIVQQEWFREAFEQKFAINNVVVSLPVSENIIPFEKQEKQADIHKKWVFFYPATPMIHKNFEVICKAAALLEKKNIHDFEIVFTFNGTENRYAKGIVRDYKQLKNIRFVGFLKPEEVESYYQNADCLLFPSKIESWGLPVTEAKAYHLAVLISDLPYAKETLGAYDKAKFFDPDNAAQLADFMEQFIYKKLIYDETKAIVYKKPYTRNWDELILFLFKE